jgi:hypothetical protein
VNPSVQDIRKLRAVFIRGALTQLMDRLACGDFEDIADAARSLANYFEWFKYDFAPGPREHLAGQLETLIKAAEHISREYAAQAAATIPPVAPRGNKPYLVPRPPSPIFPN